MVAEDFLSYLACEEADSEIGCNDAFDTPNSPFPDVPIHNEDEPTEWHLSNGSVFKTALKTYSLTEIASGLNITSRLARSKLGTFKTVKDYAGMVAEEAKELGVSLEHVVFVVGKKEGTTQAWETRTVSVLIWAYFWIYADSRLVYKILKSVPKAVLENMGSFYQSLE